MRIDMSLTGQMLSCLLFKIPLRRRKPLLWIGSCLPVPPPHHRYQPLIIGTTPSSSLPAPHHRYHPLVVVVVGTTRSCSVPPTRRRRRYHPLVVVVSTTRSWSVPPARCRYRLLVAGTARSLSVPGSLVSTLCRRYHTSAYNILVLDLVATSLASVPHPQSPTRQR
ncbi:hypothetical protein MJO29_002262, partial [Puccinia striiformis f. sp. tritici]